MTGADPTLPPWVRGPEPFKIEPKPEIETEPEPTPEPEPIIPTRAWPFQYPWPLT